VGQQQNSIENTGTQTINYSILPKVSTGVGATVDNITYDTANRGYTTYTGFGEGTWQVLPSLSVTGQGGGTYIVPLQGQDSVAPYGALTISWTLGERSSLTFNYANSVTPSDEIGANGQISDRFNSTFRYDITTRLSSHLQGSFTHANTSNGLAGSGTANNSEEEDDYYLDTGLTYQYNTYLNLDGGITLSGVDSNNSNTTNNSYTRDEVYMGVRGTY